MCTLHRFTLHRWIAYCLAISIGYYTEWNSLRSFELHCVLVTRSGTHRGNTSEQGKRNYYGRVHFDSSVRSCSTISIVQTAISNTFLCDGKWGSASWFIRMRAIKHPGYPRSLYWSKTICSNYKCGTVRHWGLILQLPRQLGIFHCFTTIVPRSTEGWHSILVHIPLAAGYAPQMDKTLTEVTTVMAVLVHWPQSRCAQAGQEQICNITAAKEKRAGSGGSFRLSGSQACTQLSYVPECHFSTVIRCKQENFWMLVQTCGEFSTFFWIDSEKEQWCIKRRKITLMAIPCNPSWCHFQGIFSQSH